jgi:hypothetical protein
MYFFMRIVVVLIIVKIYCIRRARIHINDEMNCGCDAIAIAEGLLWYEPNVGDVTILWIGLLLKTYGKISTFIITAITETVLLYNISVYWGISIAWEYLFSMFWLGSLCNALHIADRVLFSRETFLWPFKYPFIQSLFVRRIESHIRVGVAFVVL